MPAYLNLSPERPFLTSVVALLARAGLPGVTVRGIAREARCSPGFVQHHYRDKSTTLACAHGVVQELLVEGPRLHAGYAAGAVSRGGAAVDVAHGAEWLARVVMGAGAGGDDVTGDLGADRSVLQRAQVHFHALSLHDEVVAQSMSTFLVQLRGLVRQVLAAIGMDSREAALEEPATTALVWGLLSLRAGVGSLPAGVGPAGGGAASEVTPEQVRHALSTHLRRMVDEQPLDAVVNDR